MTDRLVYVGGFSGGRFARDKVANALSDRRDYAEVEAFTFSETFRNPDSVERAIKDAKAVLTHSAGVLVATGLIRPWSGTELHSIAPPIPRRLFDLSARCTVHKTWSMHRSIDGWDRTKQVAAYTADSAVELALHPMSNFRSLAQIAIFDWRRTGDVTRTVGVMNNDAYFGEIGPAKSAPCKVVELTGEHDELLLAPRSVLEEFYSKLDLSEN